MMVMWHCVRYMYQCIDIGQFTEHQFWNSYISSHFFWCQTVKKTKMLQKRFVLFKCCSFHWNWTLPPWPLTPGREAIGDGPVALWPPSEYVEAPPPQLQVQISQILYLFSDKMRTSKIWWSFACIEFNPPMYNSCWSIWAPDPIVSWCWIQSNPIFNTIYVEHYNAMRWWIQYKVLNEMQEHDNQGVNTNQDLNCKLRADTNQHRQSHLHRHHTSNTKH